LGLLSGAGTEQEKLAGKRNFLVKPCLIRKKFYLCTPLQPTGLKRKQERKQPNKKVVEKLVNTKSLLTFALPITNRACKRQERSWYNGSHGYSNWEWHTFFECWK
jgi:hypothetical protein